MKMAIRVRRYLGVPGTVALAVVLIGVLGTGVLVATHSSASRPGSRAPSSAAHHHAHHAHPSAPALPIGLVSVSPSAGAMGVTYQPRIIVRFSQPVSPNSPTPTITPRIRGNWVNVGQRELVFEPAGNFAPFTKVSVYVPGGTSGIVSTGGRRLAKSYSTHFSVRGGSTLRLQQLLAELGYLPVNFVPSASTGPNQSGSSSTAGGSGSATTTPTTVASPPGPSGPPGSGTVLANAPSVPPASISEPTLEGDIPLTPLPGSFSWRYPNIPSSLASLWVPGKYTVVTQGAVMAFEEDHGLGTDGQAGPLVWNALLRAVAHRQVSTFGYDYVYVSQGSPEYVDLWRNGKIIFQTLANTGIPQSPTQPGTWPVYLRFLTTTMSGTNPNGTHYSDPGIPWVSYFHGGDALHGFLRAQYGYPQSLGCVEMPYSSAQTLYPYTPIGTLVTVN